MIHVLVEVVRSTKIVMENKEKYMVELDEYKLQIKELENDKNHLRGLL